MLQGRSSACGSLHKREVLGWEGVSLGNWSATQRKQGSASFTWKRTVRSSKRFNCTATAGTRRSKLSMTSPMPITGSKSASDRGGRLLAAHHYAQLFDDRPKGQCRQVSQGHHDQGRPNDHRGEQH